MTTPITVMPRHDSVEAMEFTGSIDRARDIAKWVQAEAGQRCDVQLTYSSSLLEPSRLELRLGDDEYELNPGDWVIRDGSLFSVVRRQDFPLRYVTAIEKIMIEAGLD